MWTRWLPMVLFGFLSQGDAAAQVMVASADRASVRLVGLGVGAGVGILAALVVAQGCEENESRCTGAFILGGSALGAGIGAAVSAVVGKD